MKKILRTYLAILARMLLKKHQPTIIGVTGSAGKSTVTSFVVQWLQKEYGNESVTFSKHQYNGEFGLPLTVIGAKTGGKNPFKWFGVFCIFLKKYFQKSPKFLVLEYGIDTPGEMDFLLSIAIPDFAIITPIVSNHIEQFGNETAYRNEKLKILQAKYIFAHETLKKYISPKNTNVQFFGKDADISDIFVKNTKMTEKNLEANIAFENHNFTITMPVFGEFQAENVLPLFGMGKILHIPHSHTQKHISEFHTENGRNSILQGKNNTIIIDGSYNGGLLSMTESLYSVAKIANNRKIILFLGDMRELGPLEKEAHITLANTICDIFGTNKNVQIFLVGKVMKSVVLPLLKGKIPTESFLSSRMAGKKIANIIEQSKEKYLIFAKGSQNTIFLEEGLKYILEESQYIHLCRQGTHWQAKKEAFFRTVEK